MWLSVLGPTPAESPLSTRSSLRVGMTACVSLYFSQCTAKCWAPREGLLAVPGPTDRQGGQPEVYFTAHWNQGHLEY